MSEPIIELDGMEKHFDQSASVVEAVKNRLLGQESPKVRAVDGIDLTLERNQVQGVIGESGCGKTTLLKTLMGLHDPTGGEYRFDGKPVSEYDKSDWKEFRRRVQIIFQDPFNSLNPKMTVRESLKEPLRVHNLGDHEERILNVLEEVELQPAEKYLDRYPKQLSGGEKQRVSIGRALILDPDVILADEPVSMLDVSIQASILNMLGDLVSERDVSMFYISHDLSTVSYVCDRVNVMYLGRIVEDAPTEKLLREPKHPYTRALIGAIPIPDPDFGRERTDLRGTASDPIDLPPGCRFKDRCPERMPICDRRPLDVQADDDGTDHDVACHLYYDHEKRTGEAAPAEASEEVSADD
jgi:peptide/nickel transport system ATP-binding protein